MNINEIDTLVVDQKTQIQFGCLIFGNPSQEHEFTLATTSGNANNAVARVASSLAANGIIPKILILSDEEMAALNNEAVMTAVALEDAIDRQDNSEESAVTITNQSVENENDPVVRSLDYALLKATVIRASDLHLETVDGGMEIRARVDGVLERIDSLRPFSASHQAISRLKVLAHLDIAERKIPQDGRFRANIQSNAFDCRISIIPSVLGEDAVIRLLRQEAQQSQQREALTSLEKIGINPSSAQTIRRLCKQTSGLIICSGPTGSGKTSTLYAALQEPLGRSLKVITIEDPVEYRLQGALQIPVNEKKGLTFSKGLRAILRHDPDVILIGEIRDKDTAEIAVQAALTGHLVFTTLHANTAADAFVRLLNMGVDQHSLESATLGLMSQRLLRTKCTHCGGSGAVNSKQSQLTCGRCRGTGYFGRIPVLEVIDFQNEADQGSAANNQHSFFARINSLKSRMQESISNQCCDLVASSTTDWNEVIRVFGDTYEIQSSTADLQQ